MSDTRDEDLPEEDGEREEVTEAAAVEETSAQMAHDEGAEPVAEAADEGAEEPPAEAPAPEQSTPRGVPLWERLAYPGPPLWYRVAQWVLPPLLAAGAVGVHWWLNVPEKILESPKDQGADKKKARPKRPPRTPRSDRRGSREEPRSAAVLANDWKIFSQSPFDEEPVRSVWARRHQALINRAMVVARREGFEGAPEPPNVVLASTKCRTVRCRFVMRSPFAHELELMSTTLQRIEVEGESIWRSFEAAPAVAPEGMPSSDHYLQVTVGFASDDTDSRLLVLGNPEGEAAPAEDGEEEGEAGGEQEDDEAQGA